MKNNIEVRKNGAVINKREGNATHLYYVEGSKNGPWDYLRNARRDADEIVQTASFTEGFKTGLRWDGEYRPGGPAVLCRGEGQKEADEWHQGFTSALLKRGVTV